ncbi:MAG: bifunctional adenosylcobinamide kinase/adenosylcobinamide-phosphate guanylyltransferase [Chitinophagaceae bacterium]|nr:bifunctional adenosylcobinamide kinase/adenosylcobinamide-phosphate guanylyltransferase [Polaromonas sp.]
MQTRSELILGGQRSGKSRRAELLARDWLAQAPGHQAVMIATATAWDDEMLKRIAHHQQDRAERVPGMQTVEEPLALGEAIQAHSAPQTIVVVDCLTLWLTNLLMPHENAPNNDKNGKNSQKKPSKEAVAHKIQGLAASLLIAVQNAPGPVVLVGNEIGLGVIPMGRETRDFVDALGRLNQDVAASCERVTFMAAGLPLTLKGQA